MHQHDNILLTEAVERYISGEMSPDERLQFENLRKADSEVDQMVVTHTMFMQKMNRYNEWQKFQASLNEIHDDLATQGKIDSPALKGKAKVVYLFNKYKRVGSIAASIAGLTALLVSAIIWSVTPKTQDAKLDLLNRNINSLANKSRQQDQEINNIKSIQGSTESTKTPEITYNSGGTGFIIDAKGLLVTNAHVIQNAQNVAVANAAGVEYFAKVVYTDPVRDIALLKITDKDFKALPPIPYGFTRKMAELAEPVFTLGYPREDIVYNQGYLSAKTGFNGDTLSCQIEIAANRGNSGSPILNNEGDIIGILNGRQKDQEGVAFFIRSRNLYNILNEVKEKEKTDSSVQNVKLNTKSTIANLSRQQQTKKIQDYVFMVKVN